MKKITISAGLLFITVFYSYSVFSNKIDNISYIKPKPYEVVKTISFNGKVEFNQADIFNNVSTELEKVYISFGDTVNKRKTLLSLKQKSIKNDIHKIDINLNQLKYFTEKLLPLEIKIQELTNKQLLSKEKKKLLIQKLSIDSLLDGIESGIATKNDLLVEKNKLKTIEFENKINNNKNELALLRLFQKKSEYENNIKSLIIEKKNLLDRLGLYNIKAPINGKITSISKKLSDKSKYKIKIGLIIFIPFFKKL